MSHYILALLILSGYSTCFGQVDGELSLFDEELALTEVQAEQTYEFDNIFQAYASRIIENNLYVTGGPRVNTSFHVLSIGDDGQLFYEKRVERRGRGPAEFTYVQDFVDTDSLMYIYDRQQLKMVPYDKTKEEIASNDEIFLRTGGRAAKIYSISNNRFLAIGAFTDGRFTIFGSDGNAMGVYGELLNFDDNFSPVHLAVAWVSRGVVIPDEESVYIFAFNADFIEQYDFEGNVLKRIQGSEYPVPQMELTEATGGGLWPVNDGGIISFISVDADDNYIYALYSGNPRSEAFDPGIGAEVIEGNIIHKFDSNLDLVESYQLDHSVRNVVADGMGGVYTYRLTDEGLEFSHYNLQ